MFAYLTHRTGHPAGQDGSGRAHGRPFRWWQFGVKELECRGCLLRSQPGNGSDRHAGRTRTQNQLPTIAMLEFDGSVAELQFA